MTSEQGRKFINMMVKTTTVLSKKLIKFLQPWILFGTERTFEYLIYIVVNLSVVNKFDYSASLMLRIIDSEY